jgi:hypothetical protein
MTRTFIAIAALLSLNTAIGGVPPTVEGAVVRAGKTWAALLRGAAHNPAAVAELAAATSTIAPLVHQVEQDSRIPAAIKEAAKDLIGAIVCTVVLDVSGGEPFPSKEKLGVTVGSNLFARGLLASTEARTVISNLTEAHLNRVFLDNPPDSANRVRIQNGCERALSEHSLEH